MLSKPQLKLLALIKKHSGKLYYTRSRYYLVGGPYARGSTVWALITRKLIEHVEGDPSYYKLSRAGRTTLKGAEGETE